MFFHLMSKHLMSGLYIYMENLQLSISCNQLVVTMNYGSFSLSVLISHHYLSTNNKSEEQKV